MYWFKKYFTDIPSHVRALSEVLVIFLCSLLPYYVTAFVRAAKSETSPGLQLDDLFSKGQIYLLAYALFGTVFWLAFVRWDRPRHDARILLGVFSFFAVVPIIGFIGVDPTFSSVVNKDVVSWGYGFYGFFLIIQYLLLFYSDISPPDPQEIFDRETRNLDQKYDRFANDRSN
jgi:hypothetical protein